MELAGMPQALPDFGANQIRDPNATKNCLIIGNSTDKFEGVGLTICGSEMGKPQRTSEPKARTEALPDLNQQQTAAYVADVSLGLRGMAEKADLAFLTYLLDMVVQEAMQQSELPRRRRTDPQ